MRLLPRLHAISSILAILLLALAGQSHAKLEPNFTSNAGVKIYNPSSFFNTTGPWSLMSQAGDNLYIADALPTGAQTLSSNRGILARPPKYSTSLSSQH
jgi:hypothetical protein